MDYIVSYMNMIVPSMSVLNGKNQHCNHSTAAIFGWIAGCKDGIGEHNNGIETSEGLS